ncbi:hypothetical protein ACFWN7_01860 [Agromyces sp. NPDC058484]|uniref:hypothetical protein n=1 Tax=Agromyces sp. NPDC058484 TaxID=3346524 RepID=UPI003648A19E
MTEMAAAPAFDSDEALTATVLAVPGVDAVFAPSRLPAAVPLVAAALVGQNPHLINRVSSTEQDGVTVITARIATQQAIPTPETARSVADTLRARTHGTNSTIRIQVSRII